MEVQCTFSTFHDKRGSELYECKVAQANIKNNSTSIAKFNGTHLQGRYENSVQVVTFENTAVDYIPKGLRKVFPSLKELKIINCTLKEITKEDLRELQWLSSLVITHCDQLTTLSDNLFVEHGNLSYIDLSLNQIEFATSKVFEPFLNNAIQQIDLRGNKSFNELYKSCGADRNKTMLRLFMAKIDENCKYPVGERVKKIENFYEKFDELWKSGRYSDFTIVVETKKFLVHKSVLFTQSHVFAKIIDEEIEADELKIQDFSESSVELLLCFLYTGSLPSDKEDKDNLIKLCKIAAKFEATGLQTFCEKKLLELLNDKNSFEFFKLGNELPSRNLKVKAFRKIEEMFSTKLLDEVLDDPDALEELIKAKRSCDLLLEKVSKK